jgi:preprotein translocase subunit SecG
MLDFFFYATMVVFIIVCAFLVLLILIQKGRGGGLASAFGGAGGNTAFGSKTGDVLTWATSVVFGVFLLLAVGLNLLANAKGAPPPPAIVAPATQQAPQIPLPSNPPAIPPQESLPTSAPSTAPSTM